MLSIWEMSEKVFHFMMHVYLQKTYSKTPKKELINLKWWNLRRRKITFLKTKKDEIPTKMDDHQINNILVDITNHTIKYFDKEKSGKNVDVKIFCGTFCICSNFRSRVPCEMHVHPPSLVQWGNIVLSFAL